MIHTAYTVRMLRVIAFVLGLALLLWSAGFPNFFLQVEAADVTSASDTISDSAPSASADHLIAFTIPNGMQVGETFTLTFPGGFGMGSIVIGDVDLASSSADQTLGGSAGAGQWGVTGFGGNTLTFETPTDVGVGSSTAIEVRIGQNATGGSNQITNPGTPNSYGIDIGGTMQDAGQVRVAIIDNVLVSAQVDTSLTFTISGTTTGVTINGGATSTSEVSTATTIPFGTLADGTSKVLGQELTVATNATNGFVVTVDQSGNLQSSTGADIDGFIDGAYTDTPTGWVSPAGTLGSEDTYGHWALTSEDSDLNADEFGSDLWVAASTTPRQVFSHTGPADGSTPDQGYTVVGYQAEITALQEAGTDYNTTLTYIATPTF